MAPVVIYSDPATTEHLERVVLDNDRCALIDAYSEEFGIKIDGRHELVLSMSLREVRVDRHVAEKTEPKRVPTRDQGRFVGGAAKDEG